MNNARDAYGRFFDSLVCKDDFFEFGLNEIIFPEKKKAEQAWEKLKFDLLNNQAVYIRGYGRRGSNTSLYQDFYANVFNNHNVKPDPTNNTIPAKLIETLTGYSTRQKKGYQLIHNYQRSHVFGRTKNALAFTAPWNIVYLPKLLDPFTGHEAKGDSVKEFTQLFQKKCYEQFEALIMDFNQLIESDELVNKIAIGIENVANKNRLEDKQRRRFSNSVYSEFTPIKLPD